MRKLSSLEIVGVHPTTNRDGLRCKPDPLSELNDGFAAGNWTHCNFVSQRDRFEKDSAALFTTNSRVPRYVT